MIPQQLAEKVLFIYDKAINKALAQKAKNKMYFKASPVFFHILRFSVVFFNIYHLDCDINVDLSVAGVKQPQRISGNARDDTVDFFADRSSSGPVSNILYPVG
ncbi:hypothetical protein Y032_0005g2666 [Ancylostoma ceylanicum]|uniref:Uncharacterized protein n=1 Tax=Ancylostoma ceylanicum TaxID=53326 RepID=A0A016VST7_9BILA|nr:hypothetical protein Y032_0005g2666 [Ancylostoma ceylanicum]